MALPQIITSTGSEFASVFVAPVMRGATYAANQLLPNVKVGSEELINTWATGFIDASQLRAGLKNHGIEIGIVDRDVWNYAGRPDANHPAELRTDYEQKELTIWQSVLRGRNYFPSIDECNMLLNRGLLSPTLHDYLVNKSTGQIQTMTDIWKQARFEIPGPSDLVRFAVREAYNPELITLFAYNKEVPTEVLPWMEKQGYGGPTNITIPAGGTDGNGNPRLGQATWLDLYWWSHWELPSLTQGYDMLHKLYPSSPYGPSPLIVEGNSFTGVDLEKLQKAQDIPDYWRKKLQSISYNPIDKSDAEFMFKNGIMSERDFYHNCRQKGQSNEDALFLVEQAKLRKKRDLGIDPGKEGLAYVCKNYKLGIIPDDEAVRMLQKIGFDADDTGAFLAKCKLEIKAESAQQLIHHIEIAYYHGLYSDEQVETELLRHHLNPAVIQYWLAIWKYKKAVKYKLISARQNLTAYKNGVLTEDQLLSRLFNLGYDGNSVRIMIANTKVEIQQRQNMALLKQRKQALQQAKAAAQAQSKAATKAAKKAQNDAKIITNKERTRIRHIIKASSDANLKEWVAKDLIQLWEAFYRQFFKGFTIKDATNWITAKFPDKTKEEIDAASKKAQAQFRSEGNYLE